VNISFPHLINTQRIVIPLIAGTWLCVQLVAWRHFGIHTGVDTAVYVADAMAIINGSWLDIEARLYVSYALLLASVIVLTGDIANVVVVQLLMSLVAVVLLYRLTFAISANSFAAFVAAMLFVLWPDVSQWNFFVYTDAVFMNLVVISMAALYFSKTPLQYVLATILIVFTMFTRAAGVVFFLSLVVYMFDRIRTMAPAKYIVSTIVVIGIVTVNFALQTHVDSFISGYMKAEIIYPDVSIGVNAPADLWIPASHHQPIVRLLLFVLNNPVYFLKIFFIKVALFVGHMKPYFSVGHNILIALFLYPIYLLAVPGAMSLHREALRRFIVSFIVLQVVMVGFISENWDGRFLLPVLPWVFILSSLGFLQLRRSQSLLKS
jgi:hypothetical protein